MVFDDTARSSLAPRAANESIFAFLNGSATDFFTEVRRLLEEWLSHLPAEHRSDLVARIRSSSDDAFESAFWELYLHEAFRCSGADIDIHPDIPESTKRPDFRVRFTSWSFYLEAVRVGAAPTDLGEQRRLAEVQSVLDSLPANKFTLQFSWDVIGPSSLGTKKLKTALAEWLGGLDHAVLMRQVDTLGYFSGPTLPWNVDGWKLKFTALPVNPKPRTGLVGIRGPGRARGVDNATGLRRALDSKANKYGALDAPLVIAVLSNTEYPTRPYETLEALYGLSSLTPTRPAERLDDLARDGHWFTRMGWRRGHAPQVILASGLKPWSILTTRPQLWRTLEPGIIAPHQPGWLDRVDVDGPEPTINTGAPLHDLFGLPADWLTGDPDFE
jgi:hypothetical protein